MYTIKTLNAISPVGLAKLPKNLFQVAVDADAPDGILVRSADLLNTTFNEELLAIAGREPESIISRWTGAVNRASWCSIPPAPTPMQWPSWWWEC